MLRFLYRFALISAPVVAFVFWTLGPVRQQLSHGYTGICYMLLGIAALALVEGLMFKWWILPLFADAVSERLYAGNYLPEDDPLACLVSQIVEHKRRELMPELERLVAADPQRVRGWLELARVCEGEFADQREAVAHLLRGAELVRRKEDAAMLMWRAITLCERYDNLRPRALELLPELAHRFPHTTYGRLALDRLP